MNQGQERTRAVRAGTLRRTVACTSFAVALAAAAFEGGAARGSTAATDDVTQGALRIQQPGGGFVDMPLQHTDVSVEVSAHVARIEVEQVFGNPHGDATEAVYLFPLPGMAAVDEVLIEIGEKRLRGDAQLPEEARRLYAEAWDSERAAALLEWERRHVFTQRVANLEPGSVIRVRIRYVERLHREGGGYALSFPMALSGRQAPSSPADPQTTARADRPGRDIALRASIAAGSPIRNLRCDSHVVDIVRTDDRHAQVRLVDADSIPNKDFVLRYEVATAPPSTPPASAAASANSTPAASGSAAGQETTASSANPPSLVVKVAVTANRLAPGLDIDDLGENTVRFDESFMNDLPSVGRTYTRFLTMVPAVQDADGDGNPNVLGGRDRDFEATLDGVSNVDPVTGRRMSEVNVDAIESVEVLTSGGSASEGGATAGWAKIVTKEGGNLFSGAASFYLRHSLFDGNTVATGTDGETVHYHDVAPSLLLSGPIVKDKVFFLLSHEYNDRGTPQSLVGANSIVVVRKGTRNLDKVTWQAGSRNKLVFQASSDPLRIGPLGIDALTDPRSGYDYRQGGPTYQIHWDYQTTTASIQSLVGFSHTGISAVPRTHGVKNFCGRDELAAIGGRLDPFGNPGGEPIDEDSCFETRTSRRSGSFVSDYSDDRIRYTVKSDANYLLDDFLGVSHTLKAGILAEKNKFQAKDSERAFSIFTETLARFGGLDAPTQSGGGLLFRTVTIPGQPQVANNFATGSDYAAYIEDQFRPHTNVSVRVGVRLQQETLEASGFAHFDPREEARRFRQAFESCAIAPGTSDRCARVNFHFFHTYELFPVAGTSPIRAVIEDPTVGVQRRDPESIRISNTTVAPRLSLSWDPGTNGKLKLFGTAGRYYGDTFLAVPLYEQPPDTFGFNYLVTPDMRCMNDPNGNGTRCISVPTIDSDQNAQVFPANIRQVDRNLKTPYQDEYSLGFSREVFQETSISVTAIKRSYRDLFQDIDVNHFARDIGNTETLGCQQAFAGGPLVPIDRHKDGVFDDCGGRVVLLPGLPPFNRPRQLELQDGIPDLYIFNPFFNQVNRVGNYNVERYTALEIELNRRMHRNWQLEASYVWSKATGNAEDYNQALGDDPTTVQDEFGYLSYDQRHVVKVNVATQLPVWNVRLSSAFIWQTGLPYSITEQRQSTDQPRFFGNFRIAYAQARTTFPTHQRNDQRNDPFWNFDVAARKDFTLGKTNLEGSVDVFNVLNDDALQIQAVRDGRVVATRHRGRQFQIGAKLTF